MRIAIEATNAQGAATGFGRYVISLLQALAELETKHEFILLHSSKEWNGPDFGPRFRPVSYYFLKQSLGIAFKLNSVLKSGNADLFHATCTTGVPMLKAVPTVATIHDLYPLIHSKSCPATNVHIFKRLIKWTIRNSDHFLCNSNSTARELCSYFNIPEQKVTVTHLAQAVPEQTITMPDRSKRHGYLCIGAIEPRKNQLFLLEAYQHAYQQDRTIPELTFIGPNRGDSVELRKRIAAYRLEDKVKYLNYIPSEQLAEYYANAAYLVFPTLYEGFGLPLLEAMQYDLPVICSDIPVLREVGGEYPAYLPPGDLEAWSQALLAPPPAPSPECGRTILSQFSWRQCAEKTLAVYEKIPKS